jgi:cell division protein FtsA
VAPGPIVAVEIGTSKVVALVGERRDDDYLMISGVGEHPSSGLRKAEVINLENAANALREALHGAEESGRVAIREVHLVVSGGHLQSMVNRGSAPVDDPGGEITEDDVERVMNVASAINLPEERDVLHTVCQHFCIDEQERVIKPDGMVGARLSVDMLVVHALRSCIRNTVKVVTSLGVEVADVAFGGLCSALAVLTSEQRSSGVVVIDLGAGSTDFFAYGEGVVMTAGCIGVGGDHVTNDIALAFNIPGGQAERIKCESGDAVGDAYNGDKKISLPPEVGFPGRTVHVKSLHAVMNARVAEIFEMVRDHLGSRDMLHHLAAGVVLIGGGAHMNGVTTLAEQVFGLPCTIGRPRDVSGLAVVTEGPEYASAIGMVQYGFRTADVPSDGFIPAWIRGLFGAGA